MTCQHSNIVPLQPQSVRRPGLHTVATHYFLWLFMNDFLCQHLFVSTVYSNIKKKKNPTSMMPQKNNKKKNINAMKMKFPMKYPLMCH